MSKKFESQRFIWNCCIQNVRFLLRGEEGVSFNLWADGKNSLFLPLPNQGGDMRTKLLLVVSVVLASLGVSEEIHPSGNQFSVEQQTLIDEHVMLAINQQYQSIAETIVQCA